MNRSQLLSLVLCGAGVACSQSEPGPNAPADPAELVGDFSVRLTAENPATGAPARTSVLGVVKNGPEPEAIAWHVVAEAGACRLSEPEAPFCERGCGGSAVCTSADVCTPYPGARGVGMVSIRGLGSRELQMEPIAGKYSPSESSLGYPPCREGEQLSLAAEGGDYPGFELAVACIAPLAFEPVAALDPQRDLQLRWTLPGDPALARIQAKLDISHHGGAKGKIECESDDSGELAIAGDLIGRLIELGVAGFPTITLSRVSSSSAAGEPRRVTLRMLQTVERPVEVPGVTSCTSDAQCPGGQACASNLLCMPR